MADSIKKSKNDLVPTGNFVSSTYQNKRTMIEYFELSSNQSIGVETENGSYFVPLAKFLKVLGREQLPGDYFTSGEYDREIIRILNRCIPSPSYNDESL